MVVAALPNLYCLPSDVYDALGVESVQLRLDDRSQATGQTILVTTDTVAGATNLPISPLLLPLLKGSDLIFEGGGMAARVEVTLSATAPTGSVSLAVNALAAQVNANATATDSGVNVSLAALLVTACSFATSRVKDYCTSRYEDADLARSWSAKRWAVSLAKREVCRRRCNPVPKSVDEEFKETLEELKMVRFGQLNISDIGTRTAGWPFVTNTTIDLGYDYAKVRVEVPLSEGTRTQYSQKIDWNSALWLEL